MVVADVCSFIVIIPCAADKKLLLMKKIIMLAVSMLMAAALSAQVSFGIKGGVNFNSMSDIQLKGTDLKAAFDNRTGFNAGIALQAKLPVPVVSLAIQPELLYTSKGGILKANSIPGSPSANIRMDYLQLPVSLQVGLDLMLVRPYVEVVPFVGYAVGKFNDIQNIEWQNLNRFDYGVGLGIGVDIWKFQLSGRYTWSLGRLGDFKDEGIGEVVESAFTSSKMRGFELSLAFFF